MLMQTGALAKELGSLFEGNHAVMSLQGNGASLVQDLNKFCQSNKPSARANALASTSHATMAGRSAKAGMTHG